jgi:predicted nucleic acid-binding protein
MVNGARRATTASAIPPPAASGRRCFWEMIRNILRIFVEKIRAMKQRIYIDTSIVGGYFDKEFAEATMALFERLKNGEVVFVVSDLMQEELEKAPIHVQRLLQKYEEDYPDCFEYVVATQEATELADKYIVEKIVGKASYTDCRHIAVATINKVDIVASWNFKHIVNLDKIREYNAVNLKLGYVILEIRNPKDLIKYGDD